MEIERSLRLKHVMEITGLSRTEIYRRIQAGRFPKQTRQSHKVAVWKGSEIKAYQESVFGA
ncbi:AlpA family phage regulatory protein [Mesorhizobium sp. B2-1-2]|uniref:helix-turn-helix transcriptional regulator n=1 Tax=Mesorhizobium sp. B2-1-2 TaxID=2589973 RepID=UPI00112EF5EA|nr:AlpA family phage regulatory protein [Mesorhizobium sp. B2-1-2]TPN04557.1 AlpA family phage regulatory protein [Mesorhizobium sp. B2-1-2]